MLQGGESIIPLQGLLELFQLQHGGSGLGTAAEELVGLAAGLADIDEQVHGAWGDLLDILGARAGFQFEKVEEAILGFLESVEGGAEFGEPMLGEIAFLGRAGVETVGMERGRLFVETGFERVRVEPGVSGFPQEGERVGHGGISGGEAFAARAAGGGVGILDFKSAIGEDVEVVEFGAGDVEGALGIHDDANAGAFD